MLFNKDIPYPPKTVVYFIVEDAIRKGVVESVYCKLTNSGEEHCWNILEYITEAEHTSYPVHDAKNIAVSLETILEVADKQIRPFMIANKIKDSMREDEEDIFS